MLRKITYSLLSLLLVIATTPANSVIFRPGGGVGGIVPPITYNTYYIDPTGSDANPCTSGSPCATPNGVATQNPTLKCGDTVIANAGTYTQAHLTITSTPSCPTQNNVVMVKCATPFACAGTTQIAVRASYWGIQGFTMSSTSQACFIAYPPNNTTVIGVIAFVNNIALNCYGGGIISFNDLASGGAGGVGNMAVIGNIVYNSATQSNQCNSGIVNGNPVAFLSVGDQNYSAWNFSYHNLNASCLVNGASNSDQSGLNIDTDDFYTGHQTFEDNWACWNGGPGIELTTGDGHKNAGPILVRYNTLCNNQRSANLVASVATALLAGAPGVSGLQMTIYNNLVQDDNTIACGNGGASGACSAGIKFFPADVAAASLADNNWLYESNSGCGHAGCGMHYWGTASLCQSPHASPTGPYSNQYFGTGNIGGCSGNSYTTSPVLTSTTEPAAPSSAGWTGQTDTLAYFATNIANLVSTVSGSTNFGAQVAAPTDGFNKTTFLCNVYAAMPATMFVSGGGPIPNRC